jgi:chemotaxis methyl-accepting protein methylase
MKSNAIKCYKITIHRSTKPKNYTYSLDNHLLEHVSENPYLEQLISDKLKWSSHINKITIQETSILGFLRRNLKHCSKTLKETAYTSLVRSVLDYSSTVWDPYL